MSTAVGIGGDPIIGIDQITSLKLFEEDADTDLIILVGEIGGSVKKMQLNSSKTMLKNQLSVISLDVLRLQENVWVMLVQLFLVIKLLRNLRLKLLRLLVFKLQKLQVRSVDLVKNKVGVT